MLQAVTNAFELFESSTSAQEDAVNVLKIEEFIAVNNVNTSGDPTNMTVAELSTLTNINYTIILNQMGIIANDNTYILVENPTFFQNLSSVTSTFSATCIQLLNYIIYFIFI